MSIKHPSYEEPEGYAIELIPLDEEGKLTKDLEKVVNPRLLVNLPAKMMFIEVTRTTPPYMILVCRADQELNALGLLEKGKDMVKAFCATLSNTKSELTRGVREAKALLSGRPS